MKKDRLLTLTALIVVGIMCSMPFINSRGRKVQNEKPHGKSSGFMTNYASAYLGATLTDFSHACKGASSVLNDDSEKYMICSCKARRKLFTVQLIREIEVRIVTLVYLEHFSASVKNFTLLGSRKYPTNEWRVLGRFETGPWRGAQQFEVSPQPPVRFVRLLWATSNSDDSWCTLTSFKVFGVDVLETLTEDYAVDETDASYHSAEMMLPAPPVVVMPVPSTHVNTDLNTDTSKEQEEHRGKGGKTRGRANLTNLIHQVDEVVEGRKWGNSGSIGDNTVSGYSNSDNGKNRKSNGSNVYKSINLSTLLYCNYDEFTDTNSTKCLPEERRIYELRSMCMCPSKTVATSKSIPSSKSYYGGAALQILAQMSKQLKALQQELDESQVQQKELREKLSYTEESLGLIGTHLRDTVKVTSEYRDRLIELMREMDMMKSRLAMLSEFQRPNNGSVSLWLWLLFSNILAIVAFIAVCFAAHQNNSSVAQHLRNLSPRG
ncbi:uncharacterized protein TM35_000074790 [Trypanosoma theileri]|uniref:SUN domain-containing protein n=1 Tax=Trypanosoma theileri TaxID=67003 RepID=A0A1X0P2C6_9TRYP|nr:uncharacterized protein TM35_000074790 [Trypanosoma theileri]ORC91055.1 hypothetical protein TM35_000074790 [Trypanosoma theileri]